MFLNSRLVWFHCQIPKTGAKDFLVKEMHATQVKIAGNAIQLFIHCLNRNIKKCCNFLNGKITGTHSKYSYVTLRTFNLSKPQKSQRTSKNRRFQFLPQEKITYYFRKYNVRFKDSNIILRNKSY